MSDAKDFFQQGKVLPRQFYLDDDVVKLSKKLLGKVLITNFEKMTTSGLITETEAYRGPEDRGSHAYDNRRTNRTEVMFQEGGRSYIYLCYGIHHLFNVVTNVEGIPHAVLIRALFPLEGTEVMACRRKKSANFKNLTQGPGSVTQALGVTTQYNGLELTSPPIWIEDRGISIPSDVIEQNSRVGIDYAGEDAQLPWRFTIMNNYLKRISQLIR